MATSIINQAGPLPISETFSPEVTGPATIVVSGSVWTKKTNAMIGIEVLLDGNSVGKAQIFSNGPSTHRTVVSEYISISLDSQWSLDPPTPASYKLTLQPMNGDTIGDKNDQYSVTLL